VVKVCRLLSIDMEVRDASGKIINAITNSTTGARHVVKVKNISSLDRSVRVVASLPNGRTHLEFDDNGTKKADWDKNVGKIPKYDRGELECNLVHKSANKCEPLQCDEVYQQRGTLAWSQLHSPDIPFNIKVDVG
jgi:hypothetical protein